ncbi:MAG TPA: FxsA family protein [Mycobacteriales bacterium]|nr:FxsA family protein [Mycobacteriales bacterium]
MPLLLLVAFVVVPVLEIWVIVQVGQAIGIVPTLLLLIADAVLGTWLFRREGRRAWAAFRQALDEHRVPATEVADGALVVVGGAFLLSPGFVTDAVGVLCLLPPTRALLRRGLTRVVRARLIGG